MEKSGIIILFSKGMAMAILLLCFYHCHQPTKKITMPIVKSIKGNILTQQGAPVTDAVVMITGGTHSFNDIASISNEKGEFFLDNLTLPGNYTIQINRNGAIVNKTIHLNETDSVFTIRF